MWVHDLPRELEEISVEAGLPEQNMQLQIAAAT